jgi:hypothetical protein
MYVVCLLNSRKTSIKIKQLKIEPRLYLAFFSVGPGDVDVFFCSALTTTEAPRRRSPVRHFSYPLQLLLGDLLIEAEAGALTLRLWLTHQD